MVTIELPDDDALVLFELLARNDERLPEPHAESMQLRLEDASEYWALSQLLGALESRLVAPFDPEYRTLVANARKALRLRVGHDDV